MSGNSADAGGGLENKGTTMLAGCTVSGNTATADGLVSLLGGGGLDNNGGLSLVNCTVSGNTTKYRAGGGLSNRGTLSLVNCTVSGNIGNFDAVGYSVGGLFFSQSYGGAADADQHDRRRQLTRRCRGRAKPRQREQPGRRRRAYDRDQQREPG